MGHWASIIGKSQQDTNDIFKVHDKLTRNNITLLRRESFWFEVEEGPGPVELAIFRDLTEQGNNFGSDKVETVKRTHWTEVSRCRLTHLYTLHNKYQSMRNPNVVIESNPSRNEVPTLANRWYDIT